MQTASPHPAAAQSAAFEDLQAAILRLATKPPVRPGTSDRQQFGALVNDALKAYRDYMKAVS